MLPVLTSTAMRDADRFAIDQLGIPGFTLMETAGRGAADEIERRFGARKPLLIICGKGNNGGDGLVIARVLSGRGVQCRVVVPGPPETLSGDAAQNLRILQQIAERSPNLEILEASGPAALSEPFRAGVVIDALLGTGLSHPLRPPISEWVDFINRQDADVVAIDVPTGINSDTGEAMGTAVRAALTVTMGALKVGLAAGDGLAHAGEVHCVDIGIPRYVLEDCAGSDGCGFIPEAADVVGLLPRRSESAHKYSVGLVLSVTGSRNYPGAAYMASTSAARIGAGAVVCATASGVVPLLQQKFAEIMVRPLPETDDGGISDEAVDAVLDQLERAKAMVVGCGLGRHPKTQKFVRSLLQRASVPTVIDADGLHALAGHLPAVSPPSGSEWILTPHAGEFARLKGEGGNDRFVNRLHEVREYAVRWNAVVLLKGNPGFVGTPSGPTYLVPGHPALATAGTGDVLAGACAGFLAQGLPAHQAALCALSAGKEAALRYAATRSSSAMMAGDVIDELPSALAALEGSD